MRDQILSWLQQAGSDALAGAREIVAVVMLYENPDDIALPAPHTLARILVDQYRPQGWIPGHLIVDETTAVSGRRLVPGQEIMPGAGLDTATANGIMADMLDQLAEGRGTMAIGFCGDSVALGQTFFAVLAE